MKMLERINLVPQPALARRIKKTVPFVSGGLLVVGCLVVIILGWQITADNEQLRREVGRLEMQNVLREEQQVLLARLKGEVQQLEQVETSLRTVVANLMEIPKKKSNFSEVLRAVSKHLPQTVRCDKIEFGEKGGQITGTATVYRELPSFVGKLSAVELFNNVSLRLINQSKDKESNLLAFVITFDLRSMN